MASHRIVVLIEFEFPRNTHTHTRAHHSAQSHNSQKNPVRNKHMVKWNNNNNKVYVVTWALSISTAIIVQCVLSIESNTLMSAQRIRSHCIPSSRRNFVLAFASANRNNIWWTHGAHYLLNTTLHGMLSKCPHFLATIFLLCADCQLPT